MDRLVVFVDVDVQRDFCEKTGSLYVSGSPNDLFRAITRYAESHRIPIVGSVDSHAWDAWEFASNPNAGPNGERPDFPDHCVKGTPGWLKVEGTLPARFRFIPNVTDAPIEPIVGEVVTHVTGGVYFEKEVYSLFANPLAERFLQQLARAAEKPLRFFVYGIATDYCVKAAALGLAERGYQVALLTDAVAGITPSGTEAALAAMTAAGVELTTTERLFAGQAGIA